MQDLHFYILSNLVKGSLGRVCQKLNGFNIFFWSSCIDPYKWVCECVCVSKQTILLILL